MSITESDLEWRLSNPDASGGNQLAQADPSESLGGRMSTTAWAGGVLHDLFDPVAGAENAGGAVDYRCVFLLNKHASLTLTGAKAWFSALPANVAVAIGVDPTAASPADDVDAEQAVVVVDEATPPANVTFSTPTSLGAGVALGDVPAGHCKALWIRRTALNSAALAGDGFGLEVQGDSL